MVFLYVGQEIVEFLKALAGQLFGYMTDAGSALFGWIVEVISGYVISYFGGLMDQFPQVQRFLENWSATCLQFIYYLEVANAWAPVKEGMMMVSAYYSFLTVFVATKYIIKCIPGIG